MRQERNIYFENFDVDYCKEYIQKHYQEEYTKLKHSVQQLLENRFVFDGNWDMEPCFKEHQLLPMSWEAVFEEDLEWTYMLNRQEYLLKFLIGYMMEGNPVYIEKLKYFIFHWIEHTSLSAKSPTSRTLDTGIRCASWLKILLVLSKLNLISEEEVATICHSLTEQICFMKREYRISILLVIGESCKPRQ